MKRKTFDFYEHQLRRAIGVREIRRKRETAWFEKVYIGLLVMLAVITIFNLLGGMK